MTTYSTPPQSHAIEALRRIEAIVNADRRDFEVDEYEFALGQIKMIAWRELMRNDIHAAKETV